MHRRLDGPPGPQPDGQDVGLRPMTPLELASFGAHLEEPLRRSLPEDAGSPDQLLWTAYDGTGPVAAVWLALVDRSDGLHAFARRLEVREDLRRCGYGRAAAAAALRTCREMGVRTVAVSLDGRDAPARGLCEELGFGLTAQTMVLPLTGR